MAAVFWYRFSFFVAVSLLVTRVIPGHTHFAPPSPLVMHAPSLDRAIYDRFMSFPQVRFPMRHCAALRKWLVFGGHRKLRRGVLALRWQCVAPSRQPTQACVCVCTVGAAEGGGGHPPRVSCVQHVPLHATGDDLRPGVGRGVGVVGVAGCWVRGCPMP